MRHFKSWPSLFPLLSNPRVIGGTLNITKQDYRKIFANSLLCMFPNTTTLIDSSLQNWILISRQLPKQFTAEQNIRIMVGIIKMPVPSNIVSSSIAPTHNWFSAPTKKQLYDQGFHLWASICRFFCTYTKWIWKSQTHSILDFTLFHYFTCAKTIAERSFGAFPKINTSKKFKGY